MQKVLVTGGAGFIGSHLCAFLLSQNYQVICLDNFLSGRKVNIKAHESNSNFSLIEYDITKPIDAIASKLEAIDFIFHLASPASPNKYSKTSYLSNPIETLSVNSFGTHQLLDLALKNKSRFLYASSSEVYGDPSISPQVESYFGNVNPNGPRSVYDEGKRFGEAITMAFVRKYDVDARIVRIFNTYGPNMREDDGRVVSNFIIQALQNKPLTIYGKGDQTRSFSYVSDTVSGLIKTMFTDGQKGGVFNIGNPIEKTILEFATLIKELTGSKVDFVYEDLPQDDPKQRKPDISNAKDRLGYVPSVTLEEGLKKTIEYFNKSV